MLIGLNQISILQNFFKEQSTDQFYRWKFSEDCTSLMKTRLSLGKFLPDLSWLIVTSVMKSIVFHIRTVQTKMVYQIVTDEGSSSSLSSMNITVEDGVSLSKVVQFNPADVVEDSQDLEIKQEAEFYPEEDEVVELRRSKRRNVRPDRYSGCDYEPDTIDNWVRMMPYRYGKWAVVSMESEDEEDYSDEDGDANDDLYVPLSRLFRKKRTSFREEMMESRKGDIVLVEERRGRGFGRKERKSELSVIPFTPVFEPIPLEQFGLNANCLGGGGGFSRSQYFDEIEKYRSKAVQYGKKMTEMEEMMEADLCWKGPTNLGKSVQNRISRRSSRSVAPKTQDSEEPRVYKKVTLSAGAYNKLIDTYMNNIDSTIAAKDGPTNVVDQWEELKKTNFAFKPHGEIEETSSEDDEGETSENEMLWREMELCLASSYILDDNEVLFSLKPLISYKLYTILCPLIPLLWCIKISR